MQALSQNTPANAPAELWRCCYNMSVEITELLSPRWERVQNSQDGVFDSDGALLDFLWMRFELLSEQAACIDHCRSAMFGRLCNDSTKESIGLSVLDRKKQFDAHIAHLQDWFDDKLARTLKVAKDSPGSLRLPRLFRLSSKLELSEKESAALAYLFLVGAGAIGASVPVSMADQFQSSPQVPKNSVPGACYSICASTHKWTSMNRWHF